jgi:hypothetical protein
VTIYGHVIVDHLEAKSQQSRAKRVYPLKFYCSTVDRTVIQYQRQLANKTKQNKDNLIYFISKIQHYIIYKSNKQYKEISKYIYIMDTTLNIVELIENNPIARLSTTYQNKLLAKIKTKFTDNEQQLFIASFYKSKNVFKFVRYFF